MIGLEVTPDHIKLHIKLLDKLFSLLSRSSQSSIARQSLNPLAKHTEHIYSIDNSVENTTGYYTKTEQPIAETIMIIIYDNVVGIFTSKV